MRERKRRQKDRRVIKDFSDEEMREMREWPNSFTDLRSPYLVLKTHVINSATDKDERSIELGASDRRGSEMDRALVASGVCYKGQETRVLQCILTLKEIYQYAMTWFYKTKMKKRSLAVLLSLFYRIYRLSLFLSLSFS